MIRLSQTLACAAAIAASASTLAAVHVVDVTLDANDVALNGYANAPETDMTLAVGDELKLNYSFLPGQRLNITNPGDLWAVVDMWNDGVPHDVFFTQSLSFVGGQGPLQDVPVNDSGSAGWGLMAVFEPGQFTTGPGSISFTGLQFDVVITGYSDGLTQRDYQFNYLVAFGDSLTVSSVPEPAQGAMWLAGVAALSGVVRRRRR